MPITTRPRSSARRRSSARKYGDTVRVVKMGDCSVGVLRRHPPRQYGQGRPVAIITSEGSVASGVRRIEAITGREVHRAQMDRNGIRPLLKPCRRQAQNQPRRDHAAQGREQRSARSTTLQPEASMSHEGSSCMSGEAERMPLRRPRTSVGLKVVTISNGPVEAADLRKMGDFSSRTATRTPSPSWPATAGGQGDACWPSAARTPLPAVSRPATL